jgi:hypothetical protein
MAAAAPGATVKGGAFTGEESAEEQSAKSTGGESEKILFRCIIQITEMSHGGALTLLLYRNDIPKILCGLIH